MYLHMCSLPAWKGLFITRLQGHPSQIPCDLTASCLAGELGSPDIFIADLTRKHGENGSFNHEF